MPGAGGASSTPPASPSAQAKAPKPLNLPPSAVPVRSTVATPPPLRGQSGQQGTAVDALLHEVISADASMEKFRFRLKPRFESLLKADDDAVLNWGERNLGALRQVSQDQARLAGELARINPTQWTERCKQAASRPPSVLGRIFGGNGETPQYYETKVDQIRTELMQFRKELTALYEEVEPDAEDLLMDVTALQTFAKQPGSKLDAVLVDGRLRTLIAAQQTVLMTMQALDNFKATCAQSMMTIDQLLQVIIPNWRLAESQR